MSTALINTSVKEEETTDLVDPDDLENLTDEELLLTLQKLEQEKELLAQQQLLKEIEKLQGELKVHEKNKADLRKAVGSSNEDPDPHSPGTDEVAGDNLIEVLPIEELSERLEELKRQRDDLSNKKLLDEIESLQNDIQKLQVDTDHKETRMIAQDAVAVYALSPTEIELRWDSSEFGEVEGYRVYHKLATADESTYQTMPLEGNVNSCVIPQLTGDTTYHIKMEADGKDRSEIKTDVVEVTTFKPVKGFVLILANYKDFRLKALSEQKGTFTDVVDLKAAFEHIDFEVVLEENLTGAQMIHSITHHKQKLDQSSNDCFILVLTSYKYHGYIFGTDGGLLMNKLIDCLKFNPDTDSQDAGMKQRIVLIDTVKIKEDTIEELDDTYQPRNVKIRYTDLSKVEVSFKPPKLSESQVIRFVISLTASEKSKVKNFDALQTKDSFTCEFPKLQPDVEYAFEVFAVYPEVNGQAINGRIKTYSSDGNRPRLFGVEIISQSQIYAFWKPSALCHADRITYKVYLKETFGNEEEEEVTSVSYPCHIFDNLKQNTMYSIRVTTVQRENNNVEESEPAEISISTPKDGTPIIMADSTTAYILGEPNFLVATASGAFVAGDSKSFLRCFKEHLEAKHSRYDLASIIQDVRNDLVYTSDRYDMPILSSTLNKSLYLGTSRTSYS